MNCLNELPAEVDWVVIVWWWRRTWVWCALSFSSSWTVQWPNRPKWWTVWPSCASRFGRKASGLATSSAPCSACGCAVCGTWAGARRNPASSMFSGSSTFSDILLAKNLNNSKNFSHEYFSLKQLPRSVHRFHHSVSVDKLWPTEDVASAAVESMTGTPKRKKFSRTRVCIQETREANNR